MAPHRLFRGRRASQSNQQGQWRIAILSLTPKTDWQKIFCGISRRTGMRRRKFISLLGGAAAAQILAPPIARAQQAELKLALVVNQDTAWGRAAQRFADAIKYRTQGRIQVRNYFEGQLARQPTEFALLQQGVADFAIGSTVNWSPQVKELNLFGLPFMFPSYSAVDAVQAGEPGKRLFNFIEDAGVVPIAWGENGFREVTNSKRPIRQPEDFHGLNMRVAGSPIYLEIFQALGANPVAMNFDQALVAFQLGTVDGQENPVALILPYKLWHRYITLWRYSIDPLILAVNAKTWASFSREDQNTVRKVGEVILGLQKDEAREAPVRPAKLVELLQDMYGMEVNNPLPNELDAFRRRTRPVYDKWAEKIGTELVGSVEKIVQDSKN
jgi:tripartite ATP-independent transporter DctP family solute receptor